MSVWAEPVVGGVQEMGKKHPYHLSRTLRGLAIMFFILYYYFLRRIHVCRVFSRTQMLDYSVRVDWRGVCQNKCPVVSTCISRCSLVEWNWSPEIHRPTSDGEYSWGFDLQLCFQDLQNGARPENFTIKNWSRKRLGSILNMAKMFSCSRKVFHMQSYRGMNCNSEIEILLFHIYII